MAPTIPETLPRNPADNGGPFLQVIFCQQQRQCILRPRPAMPDSLKRNCCEPMEQRTHPGLGTRLRSWVRPRPGGNRRCTISRTTSVAGGNAPHNRTFTGISRVRSVCRASHSRTTMDCAGPASSRCGRASVGLGRHRLRSRHPTTTVIPPGCNTLEAVSDTLLRRQPGLILCVLISPSTAFS